MIGKVASTYRDESFEVPKRDTLPAIIRVLRAIIGRLPLLGRTLPFLIVSDFAAVGSALAFCYVAAPWHRFLGLGLSRDLWQYLNACLVISLLWAGMLKAQKAYSLRRGSLLWESYHPVLLAGFFSTILIFAIGFVAPGVAFLKVVAVYVGVVASTLSVAARLVLRAIRGVVLSLGMKPRRLLIVGNSGLTEAITRKARMTPSLGYHTVGVADVCPEEATQSSELPILGSVRQIAQIISHHSIGEIFVATSDMNHDDYLGVMDAAKKFGIPIRSTGAVFDLVYDQVNFEDVDHLSICALNGINQSVEKAFAKRAIDVVLSLVLMIIALPVGAVIALLIYLDSPGPVFFVQERNREGGRTFRMLKFRTMVKNAEQLLSSLVSIDDLEEPVYKLDNDPRITRFGRLLRRFSLDELPQLLNVLKGDMSLVGPRPEARQLVERYNAWQQLRLTGKPGITGLQQICCRGVSSLNERLKYDVLYLRRQSLSLDMEILLRTPCAVLLGRGAK